MDFVEFNLKYYADKIKEYKAIPKAGLTKEVLHEAKVLHKFLEDTKDEGYLETYNLFQTQLNACSELEAFITANNEQPFRLTKIANYKDIAYDRNSVESLSSYLIKLGNVSSTPFVNSGEIEGFEKEYKSILDFSEWVYTTSKKNTTVVFLLRDTLLPYLAFKSWNTDPSIESVPLLVGRKYLEVFASSEELYDKIHEAEYDAIYQGKHLNGEFQKSVCKNLKSLLITKFPELYAALADLLGKIQSPNICIVESGMHGSIPLLLKSVDNRINDIKLFTTLPCFYSAWEGCFFTKGYEHLRLFETLTCQDILFKFAEVYKDNFFVCETTDRGIKHKAYKELIMWYNLIKKKK